MFTRVKLLGGQIGIENGIATASNPSIERTQLNYGFLLYTYKGGSSYRPALYSIGKEGATAIYEGVSQPSFTMTASTITFQNLNYDVYYMYIKLMG